MGNSGSMPNLAPQSQSTKQRFTVDELHSYCQQDVNKIHNLSDHQRSGSHHQYPPIRLTDAYLHETYQQQQQQQQQQTSPQITAHVKVLPDFNPDGARLRCTTNGNILNSGGTISGRKEQQTQPQSSYSPLSISPVPGRHRLTTAEQFDYNPDLLRNRNHKSNTKIQSNHQLHRLNGISSNNYKNHLNSDSYSPRDDDHNEPQSIIDHSAITNNSNNNNNNNNSHNNTNSNNNNNKKFLIASASSSPGPGSAAAGKQTNAMKNKKKKIAPAPPPISSSSLTTDSHFYNRSTPQKFTTNLTPNLHKFNDGMTQNANNQQKKLRLFKTNAQSKKPPFQNTNIMDHNPHLDYKRLSPDQTKSNSNHFNMRLKYSNGVSGSPNRLNNYKDSRVQLFPPPPPPVFRREKSFDVSLLSNHRKQYEIHENSPNSHETFHTKSKSKSSYASDSSSAADRQSAGRYLDGSKSNHMAANRLKSNDYDGGRSAKKPTILESKIHMKKYSQPPQILKSTFKKELEEATKKRRISSSAIDLTAFGSLTVDTNKTNSANLESNDDVAVIRKNITTNQRYTLITDNNKEQRFSAAAATSVATTTQTTTAAAAPTTTTTPLQPTAQRESRIPQITSKKFYFGMSSSNIHKNSIDLLNDQQQTDKISIGSNSLNGIDESSAASSQLIGQIQMDIIDKFAKKLLNTNHLNSHSSESDLSSIDNPDHICNQEYKIPISCNHIENIDDDSGDIQLNVRPTLPRRQLEIPRFSPAAAWRMLNEEQKDFLINLSNRRKYNENFIRTDNNDIINSTITTTSTGNQPIEERIQQIIREPQPIYPDNKSGDSGISGDADGLTPLDVIIDNTKYPNQNENLNNELLKTITPWTPQQDLDDEDDVSSLDHNDLDKTLLNDEVDGIRGHVFSVSLPRDGQAPALFGEKDKFGFSSLQKLKRTVSGAFSGGNNNNNNNNAASTNLAATAAGTGTTTNTNNLNYTEMEQLPLRITNYRSDNWLLSRSAPNSIENSHLTLQNNLNLKNIQHNQSSLIANQLHHTKLIMSANTINLDMNNDPIDLQQSSTIVQQQSNHHHHHQHSNSNSNSLNYVTTGRHMMYLPNNRLKDTNNNNNNNGKLLPPDHEFNVTGIAKIQPKIQENLQDPVPIVKDKKHINSNGGNGNRKSSNKNHNSARHSNNHRFTFQSTVRQIERKRLAERLSKDAEEKEALRKSELEAMTRVEEEFQKKRAREKATICHQLRLYSMEENQCISLPIDLPIKYHDNNNYTMSLTNHDLQSQSTNVIIKKSQTTNNNQHHNNNNNNYRAEPDGAVSNSPPISPSYALTNHNLNKNQTKSNHQHHHNEHVNDEKLYDTNNTDYYYNENNDLMDLPTTQQQQQKQQIKIPKNHYFQNNVNYRQRKNSQKFFESMQDDYDEKLLNQEETPIELKFNDNFNKYSSTNRQQTTHHLPPIIDHNKFSSDSEISDNNNEVF